MTRRAGYRAALALLVLTAAALAVLAYLSPTPVRDDQLKKWTLPVADVPGPIGAVDGWGDSHAWRGGDGAWWFPTWVSGITRYDPTSGVWRTFTAADGYPQVDQFWLDAAGNPWGLGGALFRYDHQAARWHRIEIEWDGERDTKIICGLLPGGRVVFEDSIYAVGNSPTGGGVADSILSFEPDQCLSVAVATNDDAWVLLARQAERRFRLVRVTHDGLVAERHDLPRDAAFADYGPLNMIVDGQGTVWLRGLSLYSFQPVRREFRDWKTLLSREARQVLVLGDTRSPYLSYTGELSMCKRGASEVWLSGIGGLVRVSGSERKSELFRLPGPERAAPTVVFHDDGAVYASSPTSLYRFDDKKRRFEPLAEHGGDRIYGLDAGAAWLANSDSVSFVRLGRDVSTTQFPLRVRLKGNSLWSVVAGPAGKLLLGWAYEHRSASMQGFPQTLDVATGALSDEQPMSSGAFFSDFRGIVASESESPVEITFHATGGERSTWTAALPCIHAATDEAAVWCVGYEHDGDFRQLQRCRYGHSACEVFDAFPAATIGTSRSGGPWAVDPAFTVIQKLGSSQRAWPIPLGGSTIIGSPYESSTGRVFLAAFPNRPERRESRSRLLALSPSTGSWTSLPLELVFSDGLEASRADLRYREGQSGRLWMLSSGEVWSLDQRQLDTAGYRASVRKLDAPTVYNALRASIDEPPPAVGVTDDTETNDTETDDIATDDVGEAFTNGSASGSVFEIDSHDRWWFGSELGLLGYSFIGRPVPTRPVLMPFLGREPDVGALERDGESLVVWRSRPRGMLRATADGKTEVVPNPTAWPAVQVESAPGGAMWFGYGPGGVSLRLRNGEIRRFTALGLATPERCALDISQQVGVDEPLAWVGTQDGLLRLTADGNASAVAPASLNTPGPVDRVAADHVGGVWMAFNAVAAALYDGGPPPSSQRTRSFVLYYGSSGVGRPIQLAPRDALVRDMAVDPDGSTVWLATSAGLIRVRDGRAERITAGGTLPAISARQVLVDPEGTVWVSLDQVGKAAAGVLGYRPDTETVQAFDTARGVPAVAGIGLLALTAKGDLVVGGAGSFAKGRVFVPGMTLSSRLLGASSLLLGGALLFGLVQLGAARRQLRQLYTPLVRSATTFFQACDYQVASRGVREVDVTPPGDSDPDRVRCAAGDLLPVEEVQRAFDNLQPADREGNRFGYLVYPREIDPAASRQLDVYRIREKAVIVPLAASFMAAKTNQSPVAARAALDSIQRRYLTAQDLFNVRNAIDEPRFFFGRRSLLSDLMNVLSRGEHVALIGPRKSGKTSVLNLLQQRLTSFPVARIDLQIFHRSDERWPTRFFADVLELYDRWGTSRFGGDWRATVPTSPGAGEFREGMLERHALQTRLQRPERPLPLVLMLDEIERVFPNARGSAADGGPIDRFVVVAGALRALSQEGGERSLSIIAADLNPTFVESNQLGGPANDTNPFYRFFQVRYLPTLERDECDEMLREIGQAMDLQLEGAVRTRIYDDSGGHASLARQLASAAVQQRNGASVVDLDHLAAGLEWLQTQSSGLDDFFRENLWGTASVADRHTLVAATDEHGSVTSEPATGERLVPTPSGEDVSQLSARQEARRRLLATGVIELFEGSLRVKGGLFRSWIREHVMAGDSTDPAPGSNASSL